MIDSIIELGTISRIILRDIRKTYDIVYHKRYTYSIFNLKPFTYSGKVYYILLQCEILLMSLGFLT